MVQNLDVVGHTGGRQCNESPSAQFLEVHGLDNNISNCLDEKGE